MNDIQSRWIQIAEDFYTRSHSGQGTDESVLGNLIKEEKDKFIRLVLDSANTTLEQHNFNDPVPGTPEKDLHDKLFSLADALLNIAPTSDYSQTFITKLTDSLLHNFAL